MLLEILAIAVGHDLPEDAQIQQDSLAEGRRLLIRRGIQIQPLPNWHSTRRLLLNCYTGQSHTNHDNETLLHISEEAEAQDDPLAGVLPAMFTMAVWEGEMSKLAGGSVPFAQHWGWHAFVLPLARILARAGALWSTRTLVQKALTHVRAAESPEAKWYVAETLAELRRIRDDLELQYRRLRDDFAKQIAIKCQPANAALRTPLAALWWTLGDPAHAHALAENSYIPTWKDIRALIDHALQAHHDTMVSNVASRLWQLGEMDIAQHPQIYRRLTFGLITTNTATSLEVQLRKALGFSPSAAFGRVLVARFSGRVTLEELRTISVLMPLVEELTPKASIRFLGLWFLIDDPAPPEVTKDRWQQLAERAASIIAAERWYGCHNPYDRSMDIPLYYLKGSPAELLEAVENHRRAGAESVLWNIRPPIPAAPVSSYLANLLQKEEKLLLELQLARVKHSNDAISPQMIEAYKRSCRGERSPDLPPRDPLEYRNQLGALMEELTTYDPRYAKERLHPSGTLADFGKALEAKKEQ